MEYKNILGTDLKPSALCLGGGGFCDLTRKEEAFWLFDLFYDRGGNFIDTANVYGRWLPGEQNTNEQLIGEWMKARQSSSRMVITTKGGHPPSDRSRSRLSKEDLAYDVDSSLQALQTDHIDLYYLHRDDETLPVEEIMGHLHDFVKAGKLRYLGASNWKTERIEAANAYAQEHGLAPFVANQPMWSLATVNADKISDKTLVPMDAEMYFMHLKTGMAAIPYTAQAQGFFTKLAANTAAAGRLPVYDNEMNLTKMERVKELANAYGATVNQIALSYLLSQPFVTIPIVGCKTEQTLLDSLGAEAMPRLNTDDLLYLGLSAE